MLEQDTTRKGRVDDETELDAGDNSGEYKMEAIWDSAVHARESESGYLPSLYYLVFWKSYPEEENTWEPALAVQHLGKLISLFHKDYSNKPTATSLAIDIVLPMVRPTVRLTESLKWKQGRPTGRAMKRAKWGNKEEVTKKRQQGRGNKEEVTKRNPSPLSSKSLIIQVSHRPKHVLPLFTTLGFSFSVFNPSWKVLSSTISTLYDLLVFLPILLIGWEVFHRLIPYPVFLLSLLINGLGGFLPATWPFEIH